ncbi:NADH dehydrogenase [ubiquinone] iron-sulfur protein 1, mitochondrial [Selaginella moellendorffii]|nr:NADH dehydrogenase [ubiquinone] iron-sulfur protein 1, mitochondrial [Selaginella moellendorffii]|eukprot:XP_002991346.2 NADH dehydrogenase [ubiquinone] iron-sulfur protein 1, mitochondrial [Selaginella moellendorffii]
MARQTSLLFRLLKHQRRKLGFFQDADNDTMVDAACRNFRLRQVHQTAAAVARGLRVEMPKPEDTIEVSVDGLSIQVQKGMTVLQACEAAGIEIPRFCYHPRLSIAGNCRMCLVEVEKTPKPVASCAMPALPGMKIKTTTQMVKKAREGVMEFLLLNHPLDCPICDQGGECDLQDQSMVFGSDRGRFTDMKRSVVDKNLGPLVKTVMTRCIHCTRCVRFSNEVAGVPDLGVLGRGGSEEIGTYVERLMTSELSGNVIDVCPVGALTSRPFAFTARNWELKGTETIDVSDAIGCNIRIESRGAEVMRIVPRLNEDVNEEWISDKARFCYDGLKRQRLNEPMLRGENGNLEPVLWQLAFRAAAEALKHTKPEEMAAIAGKLADAESMLAMKDFFNKLGCENLWCEGDSVNTQADLRSRYLLNSTIAGVENADVILLVGTQVRTEAPLLNLRIRKAVRNLRAKVGVIGPPTDLAYEHENLGTGPETLLQIAEGRHRFCTALAGAQRPAIIVGAGIFERPDRDGIMAAVETIAANGNIVKEGWNGFNVLLLNASHAAALDLGLVPKSKGSLKGIKFLYLLDADEVDMAEIPKDCFVVYQGHHGDRSVYRADVVLPGCAYSEKESTYVNTEGRTQQTIPAVPTVGESRDDWKIIRALSEVAGSALPYDTISSLRARMLAVSPNLFRVDELQAPVMWPRDILPETKTEIQLKPFARSIDNFYMTDSISRASKVMAQCTTAFSKQSSKDKEKVLTA